MNRWLIIMLMAFAVSRAQAWNTPADITYLPDYEIGARLARDSAGNVHLVWYGGVDSASWQVYHQTWNGLSWSPPVLVSGSPAAACDIAVDANDNVHVVWNEGGNPEAVQYRKRAAGIWGPTVKLANSGHRSLAPRIAVNSTGESLLVVWHESAPIGGGDDILARSFNGGEWRAVENVSQDVTLSRNAAVAMDAAGGCHIVWEDLGDGHLYHRERQPEGGYGAKTVLDSSAGRSSGASLALAGNGQIHVVWHEYNRDEEVYYRKFNGTVWEAPVNVSQHPDPDHADHAAQVTADANGEAHLVWSDDQHIYYAHTVNGVMRPSYRIHPGTSQGAPTCVIGSGGVLHAVWPNRAPGSWDLFHARHTLPDANPPGAVSNFRATPGDQEVRLEWTAPPAIDFCGVMIRWKTNGLPVSPSDGELAVNADRDMTAFVHRGLVNGVTCQYAIFAYDAEPNYAYPIHAIATPVATPRPNLLVNPAMEEGFSNGVAIGWVNYVANDPNHALVFACDTANVDSPPYSQGIAGLEAASLPTNSTSAAGLFQVITNAQRGAVYLFVGSQDLFTEDYGADGTRYLHNFGINPTGGTSPGSSFIFGIVGNASWMGLGHQFYNDNAGGAPRFGGFHRASAAVVAESNRLSVWTGVAIVNASARDDVPAKFNADSHYLVALDFPTNAALVNGDFEGATMDLQDGGDVLPEGWLPSGGSVGQVPSWAVGSDFARVPGATQRGARVRNLRGMINAGLMQRVAVPPGQMVTFSVWARTSGQDNTEASIGIDPIARGEVTPLNVVRPTTSSTTWTQLTVSATAQGPFVTVFMHSESYLGGSGDQWSDFDDATFTGSGAAYASLVPAGAVWAYEPITNEVGSAWREFAYDDSYWSQGPAQLGYGDQDEATWIPFYYDALGGKNVSTYFRHHFDITNRARYTNLIVRLLRDDGGIVYLNGVEVFRSNLTNGPVNWATLALSNVGPPDENTTFFSTNAAAALLREGRNVLAVEIHQATPVSADISFDLELIGLLDPGFTTNRPPRVGLTAPTPDAAFAAGANITVSADAFDSDGEVTRVEFLAGAMPLGETVDPPFGVTWTNVPPGTYSLTARATDDAGASNLSAPVIIRVGATTLVPLGSVWRYLDDGSDQGTAWRVPEFNDGSWASGPAELGYGDAGPPDNRPEATVVNSGGQFSHFITTYFRHSFVVPESARFASLRVRLLRDDGGVVYLNGEEIFRSNMPGTPVDYLTLAAATVNSGPEEVTYFRANRNASLLRPGTNVVAVEVHQAYITSSDLSFDLELLAFPPETLPRLATSAGLVSLRVSWPDWAGNYTLTSATNLTAPVVWSGVEYAPLSTNGQWHVTVPVPSNTMRFYRLQTP